MEHPAGRNAAAAGRPNVFALLILIGPEKQGWEVGCLYGSSSVVFLLLCVHPGCSRRTGYPFSGDFDIGRVEALSIRTLIHSMRRQNDQDLDYRCQKWATNDQHVDYMCQKAMQTWFCM